MTDAIQDQNGVKVWLGISSVDGVTRTPILADESGNMLMEDGVSTMPIMASLPSALPRDNNHWPVLGGVSSSDSTAFIPVSVNPATGALQVQST